MKFIRIFFKILIYAFAIFGFGLTTVFFAQKFGFTNDRGIIDKNNRFFDDFSSISTNHIQSDSISSVDSLYQLNNTIVTAFERLKRINDLYPKNATLILNAFKKTDDIELLVKMTNALNIYLSKKDSVSDNVGQNKSGKHKLSDKNYSDKYAAGWMNSEEWAVLKEALLKEKIFIDSASAVTGVESRIMICCIIGEQTRIYNQARESFKKYFAPVKSLSFMTNLSYGVAGVKEGTAIMTEVHLKDSNSVFYLGEKYRHLLDFSSENPTEGRLGRLTNFGDHYYTYLYVALILKQIKSQWEKAGFDISDRPEILATLYNLGFNASKPNASPRAGGASFQVNGETYSFGSVAFDFYYSGELLDVFPYWKQKWID